MRTLRHRSSATVQQRVSALASDRTVHRAFSWLHLHQPQVRKWLIDLVRIPAPTFAEAARGDWFEERFRELGLKHVTRDGAGNVLGEIRGCREGEGDPVLLVSAHLDTVFAAETDCEARPVAQSCRLEAPGITDNGAGLSALLALAASLQIAQITPAATLLFAANVGEEGEGNLLGMRHLFEKETYAGRIRTAIALEGSGTATVVNRALGSRRLRVEVNTPGGHSWTDAHSANAIVLLARAITALSDLALPSEPRTTVNIGRIDGGTSVNSVAASASALLDIRSTDGDELERTSALVEQRVRNTVLQADPTVNLRISNIGERPAATLASDSDLLQVIYAVDRHLGLRTEQRLGSTDANLPLSLGIPAVAMAGGGSGGGMHTLSEWYDDSGREIALRRLLLTILAAAQALPAL